VTDTVWPAPQKVRRLLAGSTPLLVLAGLYLSLRFILDAGSLLKYSIWLGSALLALALSGRWMGRELALPRGVMLSGTIAFGTICLTWAWQRLAYLAFIPDHFLVYGYFLTPPGKTARLLLLQLPFGLGSVVLAVSLLAALVLGWRSGVRWVLVSLATWWLAAFITFAFPSLYLWAQGDAAIFI
jgi:hypothetical protein